MNKKEYVCIVCPIGCKITLTQDTDGNLTATGQECKRGEVFAKAEHSFPVRMLSTTIVIEGGTLSRLPVISSKAIEKTKLFDCLDELYKIKVKAPISCGAVIIKNIANTKIDVLASRSMKKKEKL